MTDYLMIAILQQVDTVAIAHDLTVATSRQLDARTLQFAARINLSEWKHNPASRQYVSFIKPKGEFKINPQEKTKQCIPPRRQHHISSCAPSQIIIVS